MSRNRLIGIFSMQFSNSFCASIPFCRSLERKNSKASIADSDEILVDSQVMSKVTTVHEENEKTGETNNVSDTSEQI